jgi:hypothetical protein
MGCVRGASTLAVYAHMGTLGTCARIHATAHAHTTHARARTHTHTRTHARTRTRTGAELGHVIRLAGLAARRRDPAADRLLPADFGV